MLCPDCGGEVWNNAQKNEQRAREGKKPMPLWTCKDKDGCGWKKWPPRGEKQSGQQSNGHTPQPVRALGPIYNECLVFAKAAITHHFGKDVATADIIAGTATLFIQAAKTGQPIRVMKPLPPPPPPPPEPTRSEYDEDSDLPF